MLFVCLFSAARFDFPGATDIHHFGSNENTKYPHYHDYVSDSVVSRSVVQEYVGTKVIKQ